MAPLMLPGSTQKAIDTALDDTNTCGRCGSTSHGLSNCPANANTGKKGYVWTNIGPGAILAADQYLKSHAKYEYVAPAPVQKKMTQAPLNPTPSKRAPSKQAPSKMALKPSPAKYIRGPDYSNTTTGTDMYYPNKEGLGEQDPDPTNTGRAWSPSVELLDRTKTLKIQNPDFALRQNFFDNPAGERILTNHFEYSIDDGTTFYEYKILDLDTKNRKKLRALIKKAIEEWNFLKVNQTSFATNYIDTIVSWKPLHLELEKGEELKDDGIYEWGRTITVGDMKQALRFRFVKPIPVHDLTRYAAADSSYENTNFDDIAKCLNLVISKSFNDEVHKLSANKFFVKKARVPLRAGFSISDSLEIIRGYFYSVKPGMGNIVLNFNISTSAVFRPVNVADFVNDNHTFDKDMAAKVLIGRNVYVDHDRIDPDPEKESHLNSEDSRYWKVSELQNGNIEDLSFRKKKLDQNGKFIMRADKSYEMETNDTFVVDHLAKGKSSFR